MRKSIKMCMAMALLGLGAASAHAELVVIVNPQNPAASLTSDQVAALYLGNAKSFPGGGDAVLADQPESSASRDAFYQKVTGRSSAQVKAVWARLLFTGKGTPPKELKTNADVKAFVAANPKAIGYVDASAVDDSVKVACKL